MKSHSILLYVEVQVEEGSIMNVLFPLPIARIVCEKDIIKDVLQI